MDKAYLTQDRHDEIVRELEELKTKGRKSVAEHLKQAKELGDLSENFDYQEAREQQSRVERQISELESVLRNFIIIKRVEGTSSVVKIGTKVTLKKNDDVIVYGITGSNESHPEGGFISNESPIGRALLGRKVGEEISVRTPKGEVVYTILRIE